MINEDTTSSDIAQQPAILGDTQKRDPLKNVRKDIKSFKKWRKDRKTKKDQTHDTSKITSNDEIND